MSIMSRMLSSLHVCVLKLCLHVSACTHVLGRLVVQSVRYHIHFTHEACRDLFVCFLLLLL